MDITGKGPITDEGAKVSCPTCGRKGFETVQDGIDHAATCKGDEATAKGPGRRDPGPSST